MENSKLLTSSKGLINGAELTLTGSKSISNRVLLLQALSESRKDLKNLSNSDDTVYMGKALSNQGEVIDVHMAGTACRFMTAYLAVCEGREVVLTGHQRLLERPIAPLVEALRTLGADIEYTDKEGFLPLRITGQSLDGGSVNLKADVSSQFISALILIGSSLKNGLNLKLEGKVLSRPYIQMTMNLVEEFGGKTTWVNDNEIRVEHAILNMSSDFLVESDWSSVAYWYQWLSMSEIGTQLKVSYFSKQSVQADSVAASIFERFGVTTEFLTNAILLTKTSEAKTDGMWEENCTTFPDLAMSLAVQAQAAGVEAHLTGLDNLPLKESNRLEALKAELEKFGANVTIRNQNALHIIPSKDWKSEVIHIATYHDHRMALAFAPLSLKVDALEIEDAMVVSKSYPEYWEDIDRLTN